MGIRSWMLGIVVDGKRAVRVAVASVMTTVVLCVLLATAAVASAAPAFVQQVTRHSLSVASLALTPTATITTGNRLVVLVGVWSSGSATAASVTDSAGNGYTELVHFKASDQTELSVWSAPITAGGGTAPTITVKPTSTADVGAAALEYSGLSTASDASVVDQVATASGTTGSATSVASGATAPTSAGNELALGMYVDSGFGDTLTAGTGYTQRANVSKTSDIELLSEDQVLGTSGATPNAAVGTGASTVWLMATLVLKGAGTGAPTVPGAPSGVTASPADSSATVSWTAPGNGGSAITSYTVTPYAGSTAQTPTVVTGSPPLTTATVTGLTNGTSYTFTVSATNAVGTGPPSASSNAVTPSPSAGGEWSPVMSWPMVAVHSILLDTGKVLAWDGWQQPEPTEVWDPSSQSFSGPINAPDSIFCSGTAELPDGRVIVIGGFGGLSTNQQGIVDTNLFDPVTSTWTRVADMHYPRWYPDLTELSDGRYVAISGNSTNSTTWADTPEVYDPSANTWSVLSNVKTSQVHEEEYPFSYLAPNGNVFTIGPSEDKSFFLNVTNQTWTQVGGASGVVNGSSVMYRPGKILYSGGAPSVVNTTAATAGTAVIDLTTPTPTWVQTAPMNDARVYHTLTMLADGTVLAVGGEQTSDQTNANTGVLTPEIWDPATQTWTTGTPMAVARNYHSTALLMPDGRVLVAGGGHDENNTTDQGQYNAQIYSPPYLFNGPRPTISSAPAATTYGATVAVSTPDASSISAVNLVSLGADTHQADMDQHFVPLSFTQGSGALSVQIPSSSAVVPPGNYMLFILNANGVPSVASFINVGATVPSAPSGVSAVAGSGSATVSWTAPSNGGSPITSYTVTPYIGTAAQAPVTVTGSPPATSTTVTGLTNGTTYTFTVTATNALGTGSASTASNAVTPSASAVVPLFVQRVAGHAHSVSSLSVTPAANITGGNRLVVLVGVWSSNGATAQAVTDSAGNVYSEALHFKASDKTEMSVWTAPITTGGGTRPTIKVTPTSKADLGLAALEYSGLSTAAGTGAIDQTAQKAGTTSGAGTVSSGPTTGATTAANELAVGFYTDSGFGDSLSAGTLWTQRTNISNTTDMELLTEDQVVGAGATPNATAGTGANTTWEMSTVVFKHG